jgi:hypothetical protein
LVEQTFRDIRSILTLTKITSPEKITLFVSASWKYRFFKDLKAEMESTHELGPLLKKLVDKEHAKEISQLVPRIVKDMGKMPSAVLDQRTETEALQQALPAIEKEFGAKVEVVAAEKSSEPKAAQALPGKVAILVR